MSHIINKVNILYFNEAHHSDALRDFIASSKIGNVINNLKNKTELVSEIFSNQYHAVFLDIETYSSVHSFENDIANLNASIFIITDNDDRNGLVDNIFYLHSDNINQNTIDAFLQISLREANLDSTFNTDAIVKHINEFIYVKKIPFESKNISYFSDRVQNLLGYSPDDKDILLNLDQLVHPDDLDIFQLNTEEKIIQALHAHRIRIKHCITDNFVWLERKIIPQYKDGKIHSIIALCRDVSDEIAYGESLQKKQQYDELTSLPNKHCFIESLDTLYTQEKCINFVVFCISLDRFKNINDALGHRVGDQVIIEVGERIRSTLKTDDVVARFSGDEFLACSMNIDYLHEATFLADTLVDILTKPFEAEGNEIYLSCSIGIAMNNSSYKEADDIIHDAYQAMYKAKLDVLIHYAVYESDKHTLSGLVSMNLESDLRRALKNDELFLTFQPIISLRDYSVNTVEALVRWQHPKKGLLMPEQFIPLAEKTGLIVELGDWVINEAIFSVNHLLNKDNIESVNNVSVNISPIQLGQIDLCERIDQLMIEHQMPSRCIKFEITESVVMDEEHTVNGILSQFRSMGIQLSMDDFGTGFSSLSNLNHLPFNYVKIDKSFVAGLYAKGSGKEFINTIIQLAHNMNMEVVAEGVETPEQALILRNLGCEYAQGYYFCKPVTLANLPTALSRVPKNIHSKQYLC